MRIQRLRLWRLGTTLMLLLAIGAIGHVSADTSSSASYKLDQAQFGSGSQSQSCSSTYCADATAGDTVVGSASSANYSAQFGSDTSDVPLLEVIASGGIDDLGVLDTDHTGVSTATVKVRSYLSKGYIIQVTGSAPTQGSHALHTDTTPTSSHAGAEQFGINLATNATPSVGADPVQEPSGTFSFGNVADNYATPNLFMYSNGDIVAQSDTSTGETDYTISMILNVSNVTPGGHYSGTFSAVVVPLY